MNSVRGPVCLCRTIIKLLDVQLTKDRVPVLYHNFVVGETGFHVGLPDITLKQFMNLKKRVTGKTGDHEGTIPKGPGTSTDDASGFQRRNYISRGDFKCLEFPPNNSPGLETRRIETSFATLEGALKEVPQNVGFNVEIKYPMEDEMVLYELRYKFEINEYCDAILEVVYTNARQRSIFFSSFHPDVNFLISMRWYLFLGLFIAFLETAQISCILFDRVRENNTPVRASGFLLTPSCTLC